MKKFQFILLFCLCYLSGFTQSNSQIVIGTIDSIESNILNEQRKIWVYVPDSNIGGVSFAQKRYPVVYLLDGEAHFHSVVGMIRQLSAIDGNTIYPKMIVVGIPNTNRTRDLTPTKGTPHPYIDSMMIATSGGGEDFLKFMEKELMPHIEANYPTEPYRMLIGHSFGGLTAIHALINHTDLFNSYVSIDPSMWWGNQQLLKEIKATSRQKNYKNVSLFLGIANTLEEGMDTLQAQQDTSFLTEHFRTILDLGKHLASHPENQLNFKYKYYPEDDHGSVPFITEYDALRFIFKPYRLSIGMEDFLNPEVDIISKINNHNKKLNQEFGYSIKPDEQFINQIAYQLFQMEQLDKAEYFFKLNVANYPKSPNVHDSMGDFYEAIDDQPKAIASFKKALEIQETDYTRTKLDKLDKKKKVKSNKKNK